MQVDTISTQLDKYAAWKNNPHIDPNHYFKSEITKSEKQRNLEAFINDSGTFVQSPKITRTLPQFLETILEKKIRNLDLNILERIVDFIASFFDTYNLRETDLSIRIFTFDKVDKIVENSKKASCALLIQNKLRENFAQNRYQKALFVDSFIEKNFNDKFNSQQKQEIWNKMIDPSFENTQAIQTLIDAWWCLALDQESPKESMTLFSQLEKHLASEDKQKERWKKINFVFENNEESEKKEYPFHLLHVFSKGSRYFKQLMSFNDNWKGKDVNMANLSKSEFDCILNIVSSKEGLKGIKSIDQMNFEEVAALLVKSSGYEFIDMINECCRRLTTLIAQSELDEDNFIAITEILKGEQIGGNQSFNKSVEIFCSSYLGTLNEKKLKEALVRLTEVPILGLSMPSQATDTDLEILINIKSLESLDLTGCLMVTDKGIEHVSKLDKLKTLKIQNNSNITAEGALVLKNLKRLEILILDGCPRDGEDFLFCFPEMTSLKNVTLKQLPLLKDWVSQLAEIPSLTALNLSECKEITEESFKLLSKNTAKLISLDVSGCINVTDNTISHFKQMPLRDLNLCGCVQLTDESLFHLLEMNLLTTLKLPGKSQITKEGVITFTENFKNKFSRDLILVWDIPPVH
jgi:hypothetical protein